MVIGLTGNIGSGKSQVARLFAMLGCAVFQSDEAARSAYFEPQVRAQVLALLGQDAYLDERRLNRNYIAAQIFNNATLREALNAIVHPAVAKAFAAFQNAHPGATVVKESALLFEAGLEKQVNKIVVVTAPEETRLARVMARDKLSREEVLKKMGCQLPQEIKIQKADFVIANDETSFVIQQVLDVFSRLHA